jgi:hypothetical protein
LQSDGAHRPTIALGRRAAPGMHGGQGGLVETGMAAAGLDAGLGD